MTALVSKFLPWILGIGFLAAVLGAAQSRRSRRRRRSQRRPTRSRAWQTRARLFPREPLPGRITRVIDGDSIEAEVNGFGRLQIRLANVDAPENDQPWGREAQEALRRLVRGTRPQFRLLYRDRYARVVALVYTKGMVVNEQLVRDGHAWAYDRYIPGRLRAKYKGFVVSINYFFRRRQLELPVFGARSAGSKILNSPVVEPVGMWGTAQQLSTYPQAARRARLGSPVAYCGHVASALASFVARADRVRWCAASAR